MLNCTGLDGRRQRDDELFVYGIVGNNLLCRQARGLRRKKLCNCEVLVRQSCLWAERCDVPSE